MSGMALYLSWVPCVGAFFFMGFLMNECHKMEQAKRERDSVDETVAKDFAIGDSAHAFLSSHKELQHS